MTNTTSEVILSRDAEIFNADGFLTARGVEVARLPSNDTTCECIRIGVTVHRADELDVSQKDIGALATIRAKATGNLIAIL